jgi:hypothetical protein
MTCRDTCLTDFRCRQCVAGDARYASLHLDVIGTVHRLGVSQSEVIDHRTVKHRLPPTRDGDQVGFVLAGEPVGATMAGYFVSGP